MKSNLISLSRNTLVYWMAAICIALPGCSSESDDTAAQLLKRQKLREANQINEKKTVEERLARAKKDFETENYENAIAALEPMLIEAPENREIVLYLAKSRAEMGQSQQAAELLASIPKSDPIMRHSGNQFLPYQWYMDARQQPKAESELRAILEQDADSKKAHHKLADFLNLQGRRFEASTSLRALARLDDATERELFAMNSFRDPFIDGNQADNPADQQVGRLAKVREWYSQGKSDQAKRTLASMRVSQPESTAVAALFCRVLAEEQNEDALVALLKDVPKDIESEPEYWYALGTYHQFKNDHKVAVRCLGEAVSRDDTDWAGYQKLSQSLEILGNSSDAAKALQRHKLLKECADLVIKFGRAKETEADLQRISDLMDELGRPWEAIAWKKVMLRSHGSSEQELANLKSRRQRLRENNVSPSPSIEQTLVGIDLASYPLPKSGQWGTKIATNSVPASRQTVNNVPFVLTNVAEKAEINFQYDSGDDKQTDEVLLHQLTGGGIGVIDFDLDGWPDLYLTQGGGPANLAAGCKPNQLWRNLSGEKYVATTESQTGDQAYGQGVAAADINQDGFVDLLVANVGPNVVFINQGDGTFKRRDLPLMSEIHWTSTIAVGDLDGDNLPDLIEVNYLDDATAFSTPCDSEQAECNPSRFKPAVDRIMKWSADQQLSPFETAQEIDSLPNYGFAAIIANFDDEDGNDILVANDTKNNQYWRSRNSDGETSLIESSQVAGCGIGVLGQANGCMGLASGDFDRNGRIDFHITNFWNQSADLYMQQSGGIFFNAVTKMGMQASTRETVGWGTQAVDFDRNGWLDFAVMNGHLYDYSNTGIPYEMRPQLFRGGPSGFAEVQPSQMKDPFWSDFTLGRTMAMLDWNRDGKTDLVANHLDKPLALLQNETEGGNYLQLELIGSTSERDAVGAHVTVVAGQETWHGWVTGGDGLLCTNQPIVDFGVGQAETIDKLTVNWPSGKTQTFQDIAANAGYMITENDDELWNR